MTAEDALQYFAAKQGWDPEDMLLLTCRYIDNQQQEDAFEDFLAQEAKEEESDWLPF